jgi:uncharacterized protein YbjT (DUF2867 family)
MEENFPNDKFRNMADGKLRVIITGVTGMVGEGVLHECLISPDVEKILVVSRKTSGISDPKLSEILIKDFFDLGNTALLAGGYDACFFCLGVSSVGMDKPTYEKLTYDLTIKFARAVSEANPGMQFCYVSGAHTDSTEKGKIHWARIKGKTENDLQKLGFSHTYLFRPGMLEPTKGLKNTLPAYKWLGWLAPILQKISPNSISTLAQLGKAMINVVIHGYTKNHLEVKDIKILSN